MLFLSTFVIVQCSKEKLSEYYFAQTVLKLICDLIVSVICPVFLYPDAVNTKKEERLRQPH